MIRILYSNRIEALVGALAAALPAPGDVDGMFDGPWLVVPSRPMELFVDLELARRRGISGNIDTLSLRGMFARLCARAFPDVVLIERGHIVGELLAALSDQNVNDIAPLRPLRSYLHAAGPAADAVDRRRVDVAHALGALFEDWSLTRPELVTAWRAGNAALGIGGPPGLDGVNADSLAGAEHALWTALFGPNGRFALRGESEGRRYLTLDDVLTEGLDAAWRPPPAIHLFGLSAIPRGLQRPLSRLGAGTNVGIYAINPCRHFWEDIDTGRQLHARAPATTGRRRGPGRGRGSGPETTRQLELPGLPPASTSAQSPPLVPATEDGDNPFLRVWGHAGREHTRLLNQLTDGDFDPLFVDPIAPADAHGHPAGDGGSLLEHLQQDILLRQPARQGTDRLNLDADGSLQVIGAPNPRRELESIAAEIWAMVGGDDRGDHRGLDAAARACDVKRETPSGTAPPTASRPPLRFSDVAVLIAGADEPYLSLARAVFHEARDLPHGVVDQPIAGASHLIEALLAVLALPLGTFTRREVLDVITHPNVRARFPDADPGVWLSLCEELAIAHGADQAALSETYIDGDVFNWDQGLKRLALGLFARGPRSGVDDPVALPSRPATSTRRATMTPRAGREDDPDDDTEPRQDYFPAEVEIDRRPDADALALLVRSLLADARFARAARMPLGDWMRFVRALLAAYVVPVTAADESARLRVFAVLDQIAVETAPNLAVGIGTALELLRGALEDLRGTRGQILGAGVAVGSLSALRAIPFRVIFVAGLGADRFPGTDRPSPLDVGVEVNRRRVGDVTPRQHDRYVFLETLLAARDRIVLTYVDRDSLTGEERDPSPVVLELMDILKRGTLRADVSIRRTVPLHRDDDSRVHFAFPAAASEAHAHGIGADLRSNVAGAAGLDASTIVASLSPDLRHSLAPMLRTIDTSGKRPIIGSEGLRNHRRVLRLTDLRRFLECPLQGSARVFLGLRDLPDDTEARKTGDEPFEVPRWLERGLLGDVAIAAWNEASPPDRAKLAACYDAAVARPRHGALLPAGPFRANLRRHHLELLESWVASLAALGPAVRGPAEQICFGRPEPTAPAARRRDAIRMTVAIPGHGEIPVEIHGTTEPQIDLGSGAGSLVLAMSSNPDNNDRDSLRAFLDHVVLAASRPEDQSPAGFVAVVCRPSKDHAVGQRYVLPFAPLRSVDARRYLADLAGELLGGISAYLFPCEAVFRSWDEKMSLVDCIDQVRADKYYRDQSSSNRGPVPEPFDYPTPGADRAEGYAAARFGLLRAAWAERKTKAKKGRP